MEGTPEGEQSATADGGESPPLGSRRLTLACTRCNKTAAEAEQTSPFVETCSPHEMVWGWR